MPAMRVHLREKDSREEAQKERRGPPQPKRRWRMEDGGWNKPERCQGIVCQGNNPENAFSIPLTEIPLTLYLW